MPGTPTVIADVDRDVVLALERRLGPPIDSYLNGWQVWIEPMAADEGAPELECRLHPPVGFTQPRGLSHHDLWDEVVAQLADGAEHLRLGDEQRHLRDVWTLLEVFPAFGDDVTVTDLGSWAERELGVTALGSGQVDHARLGGRFRRRGHDFDLAGALRAALTAGGGPDGGAGGVTA